MVIAGIAAGVFVTRRCGRDFAGILDTITAIGQTFPPAAVLAIAAVPERTAAKYGDRGRRYVDMETGHAAQNVYLQAAALGLGTVTVGAFDDAEVARLLGLGAAEEPLYLMPVGHPR